jgi:hypothetical protein
MAQLNSACPSFGKTASVQAYVRATLCPACTGMNASVDSGLHLGTFCVWLSYSILKSGYFHQFFQVLNQIFQIFYQFFQVFIQFFQVCTKFIAIFSSF